MPLKSKAQEKYLWAKKPGVAQEFEDATPKSTKKNLPQYVSQKKSTPKPKSKVLGTL